MPCRKEEQVMRGRGPLALVYRGPAAFSECSEAAATLLCNSPWGFEVRYVGPHEELTVSEATLKSAVLYVQPGGGSLKKAYRMMKASTDVIRGYVASGGRYVGICLGGYLAGATPGFDLLPGDTDQFITSAGASVRTEADAIVQVHWRNEPRYMYFQDGPYFCLDARTSRVTVLARYTNGEIAAMVAHFGRGKVGVIGPHPEAMADWYNEYNLVNPDGISMDLGLDIIDTLMK